jgi:hypothetical protein
MSWPRVYCRRPPPLRRVCEEPARHRHRKTINHLASDLFYGLCHFRVLACRGEQANGPIVPAPSRRASRAMCCIRGAGLSSPPLFSLTRGLAGIQRRSIPRFQSEIPGRRSFSSRALSLEGRFATRLLGGFLGRPLCGFSGRACRLRGLALNGAELAIGNDRLPSRLALRSPGSDSIARCFSNAAFFAVAAAL